VHLLQERCFVLFGALNHTHTHTHTHSVRPTIKPQWGAEAHISYTTIQRIIECLLIGLLHFLKVHQGLVDKDRCQYRALLWRKVFLVRIGSLFTLIDERCSDCNPESYQTEA
jgi:hypothetical protein